MSRINLLLVDDHPVVRDGVRHVLETQPDLTVVAEADNGREALAHLQHRCTDIVIMDISMPDLNGIEATRQIGELCPGTGIIILSMHGSTKLFFRALQAGARGYLLKGAANNEIVLAVRAVYQGQRFFSEKIRDKLSRKDIEQLQSLDVADPLAPLSSREREVLQLVVEGKSSVEIAELLYISVKTVETYRHRLMHKLNIYDVPSLVKFAVLHNLTPLE